ncbi:MAG: hypothetical protein AB7K52_14185 [Phycisphaerales bacterium]
MTTLPNANPSPHAGAPAPLPPAAPPASPAPRRRSLYDRFEALISRLSSRYTFFHRLASLIWLPYAFRSGIRIKREGESTFSAVLPFKKFNRNWYNAMAGASLLANSEIAGGMYIYGRCGGDYTVVCKKLTYEFLRPCFGPAVYRITPLQDLDALIAGGGEEGGAAREGGSGEFNFDIELDIVQTVPMMREKRVGKCFATFHVTHKSLHAQRAERRARAASNGAADTRPPAT